MSWTNEEFRLKIDSSAFLKSDTKYNTLMPKT